MLCKLLEQGFNESELVSVVVDDEFGLRLSIFIGVLVVSFGPGQQVLYNVDTHLEKLLRALGEEGVLDLLLLLLDDASSNCAHNRSAEKM